MPQNEIVGPENLHNEDGSLANPGFARALRQTYDRSRIKASKWRLKKWDYYLINNAECALCLTIADLGYASLYSVSLIDFGTAAEPILDNPQPGTAPEGSRASCKTTSVLKPFTFGRTDLPCTSKEGVSSFENAKMKLRLTVKDGERHLAVWVKDFFKGRPLEADITLGDEPRESMVIATPFRESPLSFYLNQKIVAMRARGSFALGGNTHIFAPDAALGLLDWGRGVWTRDNTWYWAAAQGYQGGRRIGFNLGYGFGDTAAATENMFFLDGVAHKLDRVDFGIPDDVAGKKPAFLKPWHVTSNDGRIDFTFTPMADRIDYINLVIIVSDQHQVMGRCTSAVTLDDGTVFEFQDLVATAEKIRNKW
ncbi:hypothetical protein F4802DRAFT_592163 [Xylaria palmicola]|nr:hypothetical protein F4802DRAFT_592163 [Xylaria palmicola]